MQSLIEKIEAGFKKSQVVKVKSGDTVRVHQKISEGGKERIQIFEGLVIRTDRQPSLTSSFTVRRIASGVGVEKSFMMHSPSILKVEVVKRSKVRRNNLSYMRQLTGKSARLAGVDFDKEAVNKVRDEAAEAEEAKIQDEQRESYDPEAAKKEKAAEKAEAAVEKSEEKSKPQTTAESPASEPKKQK